MAGLGEKFIKAREKKGLSIIQIENATGINSKYLLALEEEKFVNLPDKAFIEEVIKTYGTYLGLNYSKLLIEFNTIWMDANTAKEYIKETYTKPTGHGSKNPISRKKIAIAGFFVVLTLIFFVGFQKQQVPDPSTPIVSLEEQQTASIDNHESGTIETINEEILEAVEPEALESEPAEPEATSIELKVLVARSDCWLEVQVDEEMVMYRLVPKGEDLIFEANSEINILFGNAAAVDVTYNGQFLGPLGEENQVIRKTFD